VNWTVIALALAPIVLGGVAPAYAEQPAVILATTPQEIANQIDALRPKLTALRWSDDLLRSRTRPDRHPTLLPKKQAFDASVTQLDAALARYAQLARSAPRPKSSGAASSDAQNLKDAGAAVIAAANSYMSAGDSYWPPAQQAATTASQSSLTKALSDYQDSRTGVSSASSKISSINNLL